MTTPVSSSSFRTQFLAGPRQAILSCGGVNALLRRLLGEALRTVDLAYADLAEMRAKNSAHRRSRFSIRIAIISDLADLDKLGKTKGARASLDGVRARYG